MGTYNIILLRLLQKEFIKQFDLSTWKRLIQYSAERHGKCAMMERLKILLQEWELSDLINFLICWRETPEGWDYWHDKHVEWHTRKFSESFEEKVEFLHDKLC